MKITKAGFPTRSVLNASDFDYSDSYQGNYSDKKDEISAADIGKAFFTSAPRWTAVLFHLRNKVVSIFGLKVPGRTNNRRELSRAFKCKPGETLGLFRVYDRTQDEVILGEDDKHLNFRISLLKENSDKTTGLKKLTISTTVKFNNWLGKLYFVPVKPFHQLIVPIMLRRITKQVETKK